jgi:hypothetical protein
MQERRFRTAAILMLMAAACGEATGPADAPEDLRGVEEIGTPAALTALTGTVTFNATTGAMSVPLSSSDKLLIVSRRGVDNAILLNSHAVTDPAGVTAVATGTTGLLKTLSVTVGAAGTTVVLDYLNGYFAPGVTGTFTATAPLVQGTSVDFAACTGCAFKIRATGSADTVFFGKDKTANANKLISFNNGNFGDVWVKTSGSPVAPLTYGISLGAGNDVFNASPGATTLGGLLNAFVDPIVIHGGLGDDTITGGHGADTIFGDEGDNLVDESGYLDGVTVTAGTARTLTFSSSKTITASSGSFITDGFTAGSSIAVSGTVLNGTVLAPKTFTIATGGVAATVLTVNEVMATETAFSSAATVFQVNTTHPKDSVFGLASSGTTTVSYAARTVSRAGAGVVVKIGHDTATPPAFLTGTEDNLDETVAVVIGTDFPNTMSCSDTTDAPCTLVGGKSSDTLTAGKSTVSIHKLYGGDGADTLIVTDNTDNALLVGGNWTDAAGRTQVVVAAATGRTLTFNVAKTITASTGSFITDGFAVGQSVVVTGTILNGTAAASKTFTLNTVTATVLTVNEAVATETTFTAAATVTLPSIVAARNTFVDTVDFSALKAAAVTINVKFPYPSIPKGYTAGAPFSGAAAKLHTNLTTDITKVKCPAVSAAQVCTFVGNNSGDFVSAGKGADVLTGGTGDDTFDLSAFDASVLSQNLKQVNGGGGTDSVDFSGRTVNSAIDLSCATSTCKTSGSSRLDPGVTVTASATRTLTFNAAKTITAAGTAAGSFIFDGFTAGQTVTVAGTTANDGTYTIASATATVLTVVETVVTETTYVATASVDRAAADAGIVITAAAGRTLTFDVAKTITASTGSFVTDGFADGQSIVVSGTTANDGTYTIAAGGVAATVLTVVEAVVTEGTYSSLATITRAPAAKLLEGISLVGITNATCPASAGVLSCALTGSSGSNILDFNGCKGTVSCGGGSDIILNAAAGVDTSCGI